MLIDWRLLNRLHAEGLEKSGETLAAFREYLDLVQEVGQSNDLIEMSFDHRVRDDRWLRGRLTHLQSLANEALRQQMQVSLNEVIAAQEPAVKPHYAGVLGIDLAPQLHLELALSNGLDRFKTERILLMKDEPDTLYHTSQISTPCRNDASTSARFGMNSWAMWPLKPVSTIAFITAG